MRRAHARALLAALTVTGALFAETAGAVTWNSPTSPPGAASASDASAVSAVSATVHTAGRVKAAGDSLTYSWPGVYFEGRFRGTGVGVILNDSVNDYSVEVDGTVVATLVKPGRVTHWVRNLRDGTHLVRLVKRTESPWSAGEFGGFVAAPGGAVLPRPPARQRQIEFIGDSYTAGYGNLSGTRDCSANGGVDRNSNADVGFAALTARSLDADYQINAFSGRGMVRNYNGGEPGTSYRTYYDRALLGVPGDIWERPRSWQPQLVVIGLGINDFSTAINPGEPWTPESLVAAYKSAYHGFLDKLRARYGSQAVIVVSATAMSNTTAFADAARQIVQERGDRGDDRVRYWYYDSAGLEYGGCDWHPSARDHRLISERLDSFIATLGLRW